MNIRKDLIGNQYGKSNKGKKRTAKQKIKYRLSKLGDKNPMFGKKLNNKQLEAVRITGKKQKGKPRLSIRGNKHYNWKGGKTPLVTAIRMSLKYRQWKSDIFTRDNFTCQDCGDSKGGNLEAHHFKQISTIVEKYKIKTLEEAMNCEELWNLNNGVTLCSKCHKKIPIII